MYYNQRQFYFSRAENMQKLSRIKSPALKRAVIGLGLITAGQRTGEKGQGTFPGSVPNGRIYAGRR